MEIVFEERSFRIGWVTGKREIFMLDRNLFSRIIKKDCKVTRYFIETEKN